MTLSDEVFDALLILMYLATPLVWAATLYFQDTTRSSIANHPQTGWNPPDLQRVPSARPAEKV